MSIIRYIDSDGKEYGIDVPVGENVMRGALYNGVDGIVGECGGLCCATCHVCVDEAWTARVGGPASVAEEELLESAAAGVRSGSRLSCQIEVTAELEGLIVHLPETQF